jgi:hypothetical protein
MGMALVDDKQMIQTLGPGASDPALGERVRPRCLYGCSELVSPRSTQAPIKRFAVPAVPVDEIPRRIPIPATGVDDLRSSPVGGGMSGHPHLKDLPSLVVHHEEDLQRPEEDRPHTEEVARPDVLGMAGQQLPPCGRGDAVIGPAHVLGYGPGRHGEAEPRELCPDTALSPQAILDGPPGVFHAAWQKERTVDRVLAPYRSARCAIGSRRAGTRREVSCRRSPRDSRPMRVATGTGRSGSSSGPSRDRAHRGQPRAARSG